MDKLSKLGGGTLVFVPGLMGSELRLSGTDSLGLKRDSLVWGEDCRSVWNTLAFAPEILGSRNLVATSVIRAIHLPGGIPVKKVYGPLLDFCCAEVGLTLTLGSNFRTFPYDWRLDLIHTAKLLKDFVHGLPEPVFIVAHSMGGLVARLMLNMKDSSASRVRGVFQIASPIEGSANAFISLKKEPSFGFITDMLWKSFHQLDALKRAKLMNAVGNMESLYQLLPPRSNTILLKSNGRQLSALDSDGWQKRDHPFLTSASRVHKLLEKEPSVPIKCVYAVALNTNWLIAIDDSWNILATSVSALGDGTVTTASASAVSPDRLPISDGECEHTKLCSRCDVHEELRKFLT